MLPLDASTFVPRGATPLLDATGRLISRAAARRQALAGEGRAEEVVYVSITDGHENASRELTLETVRRLVDERTADGWTFVFLSAAFDVYGEAGGLGYAAGSSQSFAADARGTDLAMLSLSDAMLSLRRRVRSGDEVDKDRWGAPTNWGRPDWLSIFPCLESGCRQWPAPGQAVPNILR